jgi:FkbM family methyltransferase
MTTAPHLEYIDAVLREVQSESESATIERESTMFDRAAGNAGKSLVLFGAGYLGKQALRGLRQAGLEPLCFADNNPTLWNTSVEGLPVLSPDDAVRRYGQSACFIVTVYNGSAVRRQLRGMDCARVIPIQPLFWKYREVFIPSSCLALPHTIAPQARQIRACYDILADEASKRELCEQVAWRWSQDYSRLSAPLPPAEIYFPCEVLSALDREVFVDCGAFDGDSIRSFLEHRNNRFEHIYGLEPDPNNRARLDSFVRELPREVGSRISVLPYGVGKERATIGFQATSTAGSHLQPNSETVIAVRPLDEIFADVSPTHIKMDIEGAEPEALAGAAGLLRRARPALSVCVYHRSEHLWDIPLLIKSLVPDYSVYIRRYAEDCWELVCYAVPPERIPHA